MQSNKAKETERPAQIRFAFYHQSEALLFQFLLHECLQAHQILRKKPKPEFLLQLIGNHLLKTWRPSFGSGTSYENWQAPHGHLPRLNHYCMLMFTHFNNPPTHWSKKLAESLERSCTIAVNGYQLSKADSSSSIFYSNLKKEIRGFMDLLLEKLQDFKQHASVLYFLLCHRQQFDALYKRAIIKKTFQDFFPEGVEKAQEFLVEKFSKKGFNHLIPNIEEKIRDLTEK